MQIRGLHKNIYRLYRYARTQETLDQYRKHYEGAVKLWESLKQEKVSDPLCERTTGISRATYFRYKRRLKDLEKGILPPSKRPKHINKPKWGESELQKVLTLRRENPTYGKEKLSVILRRDLGILLSPSTVGRILKRLMNRGLCPTSLSAPRSKRRRSFGHNHSTRWTYKPYEAMKIGERVQIDHMTVYKNGIALKHFQAWDRKSKFIYANVYSHAKSSSAKRFLLELIEKSPFKVLSIQVDGGSEFMADFERACEEQGIPLMVLPPRKPQYNGGVERGNRIFREEFYNKPNLLADSIGAFRYELSQALLKYNTYRPHFNLNGLTPMQYVHNHILEAAS